MEERIWRASVSSLDVSDSPVPEAWETLGGRGLIARILLDEVAPQCAPLGDGNSLIWAPGLLVGHMISSCDRISIGGKSPITGGVKESNAGGTTGLLLTRLGIKALMLEGSPADDQWQILHLSAQGGRFEPAGDLAGLGVYQSAEKLVSKYGEKVGLALIGPAGEWGLASAGVQNLDKDGEPSRINARGGLGAVMGSKRIKALVIDGSKGEKPSLVDRELFEAAKQYYTKQLMAHPQTTTYADYGTAAMVLVCNELGGLPTRSFSSGQFEGAEKISGEALRDVLLARGGKSQTTHACMAGCTIRCSNCFGDESGEKIISPLEYETIGLLGSNLGIDSLDTIAQLNWQLNDLGVDTIEVGAALGVAAEAGLMEFGDSARALQLVDEIRKGTPLGRVLGHGAAVTGRVLGIRRVPVAKGQAISAYDPRAIKGIGITYATSPQGADHTAGMTIRAQVNHLDPKGQAKLSLGSQIIMAGYDTLGVCLFGGFGFTAAPGAIRDLLRGRYGWDVGDDPRAELGKQTLRLEREFNLAAGFTPADDRLPEWLSTEPLPPHQAVFDVPEQDLDGIFAGLLDGS